MAVFISTTFYKENESVLDVVKLLTEHGIHNIELGSTHKYEENLAAKLKQFDCNFLVHNYFPPSPQKHIVNIASQNDSILKASLEHVKASIQFCREIGAELYTFHPGFLTDPAGESKLKKSYDFDFENPQIKLSPYDKAFSTLLDSVREICEYARQYNVKIACESQGSVSKREFLLMSRVEEFELFFEELVDENLGVSLNLGHLNLAANAHQFDKYEFIEHLKHKIVTMEVSENNGVEDEHKALSKDSWCLEVIRQKCFDDIPIIFEGRNLDIETVCRVYDLLRKEKDDNHSNTA